MNEEQLKSVNRVLEPAISVLVRQGYKFTLLLAIADPADSDKSKINTELYDTMPTSYRESVRQLLAHTRKRLLYRQSLPEKR